MRFTLVPSPLLGPSVWATTARALVDAGHEAFVATVDELPLQPGLLVPHSNAGYWTAGRAPAVFVDAALPPAGATSTALAPPAFLDFLRGLADDRGVLPPWTHWWGEDVAGLFPDAATRTAVETEQPRLPLSWFEQQIAVPPDWERQPAGFLGFGDAYAEEQSFAREQGWPVRVMPGGHLQMLHDPVGVAAAVVELTKQVDQVR